MASWWRWMQRRQKKDATATSFERLLQLNISDTTFTMSASISSLLPRTPTHFPFPLEVSTMNHPRIELTPMSRLSSWHFPRVWKWKTNGGTLPCAIWEYRFIYTRDAMKVICKERLPAAAAEATGVVMARVVNKSRNPHLQSLWFVVARRGWLSSNELSFRSIILTPSYLSIVTSSVSLDYFLYHLAASGLGHQRSSCYLEL